MTSRPPAAPARRRRSRRKKGGAYAAAPKVTLTSHPTGRAAYNDTRQWLLEQHGPVCAYCERAVPVRTITLDHVTPRRGQTAYDRRDNLVLCCKSCNAAKKDQAILAFLLGNRKRVVALYKYGRHLSHQLVQMVDDLLPAEGRPPLPSAQRRPGAQRRKSAAEIFGDLGHGASPYRDT
jgi:5-methylcytosine-specific restriction endonuclease McrA